MLNVPAQLGVQASTDHQHVAVATAVYLTAVEIGGAVGSAVSGAIWGRNIPAKLREYLPAAAKGDVMAIYNSIDRAREFGEGSPERVAVDRAYQETMRILLVVAICVAVPLLPLSLLMENYKLDGMRQGAKGLVIGGRVEEGRRSDEGGVKKGLAVWLRWPVKRHKRAVLESNLPEVGT